MSRRRQPHRIPPPISHGSETLDAEIILHEFPSEVGLQLWRTVRTVRLWGDLTPEQRAGAFVAEAYGRRLARLRQLDLDPDLRESLETAATVLQGDAVHLEAVVTACQLVASWAEERGALGTALEFTQAAALLMPADAELVHSVARTARAREEYARAESWYRQAIAVSRRTHDWISLTGAYLGLGSTFLKRGSDAAARQTLVRGIRAAARHSLWEERALLSHELARLAMRTERGAEAVRSGRAAFEAYGPGHRCLPVLALELGVFWARSGYAAEALRVLQAVDPEGLEGAQRLSRAGALTRAAGMLEETAIASSAWKEGEELVQRHGPAAESAEAWLDFARGALASGDRRHARAAAERASRLAEIRRSGVDRAEAEAVLNAASGGSSPPGTAPRRAPRELRRLAEELANAFTSSAEAA